MPFPNRITIATRESALALWQANHIRDRLVALYPGLDVRILGMTTQGDRMLSSSLAKIGGKGLFVKELESALEEQSRRYRGALDERCADAPAARGLRSRQ